MSEIGDIYKALKEDDKRDRAENREQAHGDFQEASRLASRNGMVLKRHSDAQYQLKHIRAGWILDIYPGNQRLYRPNREPRAPFIDLRDKFGWTLNDVVQAAVETQP